jgi:hypothetical protein
MTKANMKSAKPARAAQVKISDKKTETTRDVIFEMEDEVQSTVQGPVDRVFSLLGIEGQHMRTSPQFH